MLAEGTVYSEWRDAVLWWNIEGEWISDPDLRSWVYRNMESPYNYVDVIRQCHVEAFAKRKER